MISILNVDSQRMITIQQSLEKLSISRTIMSNSGTPTNSHPINHFTRVPDSLITSKVYNRPQSFLPTTSSFVTQINQIPSNICFQQSHKPKEDVNMNFLPNFQNMQIQQGFQHMTPTVQPNVQPVCSFNQSFRPNLSLSSVQPLSTTSHNFQQSLPMSSINHLQQNQLPLVPPTAHKNWFVTLPKKISF